MTHGSDYNLYRRPKYVDIKAGFEAIEAKSVSVGIIKPFAKFPPAIAALGECQKLSRCACEAREVFNVHLFGTIKMTG